MSVLHRLADIKIIKTFSDCSTPFIVGIYTDNTDVAPNDPANAQTESGVCLNYVQIPCGTGGMIN